MMKKVFVVFLVFTYLNCYVGCATKITKVSYDEFNKTNSYYPIKVMSTDSIEYCFDAKRYNFINQTLIGTAEINGKSQSVKLARSEILSITTEDKILTKEGKIILKGTLLIGVILISLIILKNKFEELPRKMNF